MKAKVTEDILSINFSSKYFTVKDLSLSWVKHRIS